MKFIKSLLLALLLLTAPQAGDAFYKGGTTEIAAPAVTPPAPALAAGYNTLIFGDEFDSLATIDVNNTLAPGFKWYVQSLVLGTYPTNTLIAFASSSFTMPTPGILHYAPNTPVGVPGGYHGGNFFSAGYKADNTFVGTLIDSRKGFYAEARMKYDPTCINATKNWFPAFWMWQGEIMYNSGTNTAYGSTHASELDIFEATSNTGADYVDWDWFSTGGSNVSQVRNTNYTLSVPSPIDNQYHIFAINVIPQNKKSSGTFNITRYVDNVYKSAGNVDYTSAGISSQANSGATTGWMSGMDSSVKGMTVQFQAGEGCPIDIDWVHIFQQPLQ